MINQVTPTKGNARVSVAPDRAVRELSELHGPVLFSFLTQLTRRDPHKAEDILQETLIRAWRHPEARRPDGTWSRPWLFTVARRIAIDQVRATQSRPMELSDDRPCDRAEADNSIERLIDASEVRAALRSLPDRLRHVLIEVYFRERSVAETAAVLNVPPGTVKSRTFYALAALRDALLARDFTDQGSGDRGALAGAPGTESLSPVTTAGVRAGFTGIVGESPPGPKVRR